MRIAIVNDVPMAVEALKRLIASAPQHQIAWVAFDGAQAVKECARDRPDLILMDLIMPVMDGVEATRQIMRSTPCAILVVTVSVKMHSKRVFEALSAGALDAVPTPTLENETDFKSGAAALLYKIGMVQPVVAHATAGQARPRVTAAATPKEALVILGASAGGPSALMRILSGLHPKFSGDVVIVQHLDAQFAPGLATWLNSKSAIPVRVAKEGDRPAPGLALLAATNDHLVLRPNGTLGYTPDPVAYAYRPSVDVFFNSVLANWKGEIAAAVLTGMGRDGAEGLKGLRDAGHLTIAQSRGDAVVYGMPKAAAELGGASEILNLEQIEILLNNRF